jgi:hypothetical protein
MVDTLIDVLTVIGFAVFCLGVLRATFWLDQL